MNSRLPPKVKWKAPWALLESYSGRQGSQGRAGGVVGASAEGCSTSTTAAAGAALLLRCRCFLRGTCCPSCCSSRRLACLRLDGLGGPAAASASCCCCSCCRWRCRCRCCRLRLRLLAAAAGAAASASVLATSSAGRAEGLGSAGEGTACTPPATAGVDKGGMADAAARGVTSPLPPLPATLPLPTGPVATVAAPGGGLPTLDAGPVLLLRPLRPLRPPRLVARCGGSGGTDSSRCAVVAAFCCARWLCMSSSSRARRMGSNGALPLAAAGAASPPCPSGCAAGCAVA